MTSLLSELGITPPKKPLEEPIRVRIDTDLRRDLDRIEAYARGAGYRDFSRSDLIRAALASFVEGVRETIPEISAIVLPEEREVS